MPRPQKYTKPRTIKFSEVQDNTLKKMKYYNVDIAEFIRQAVKEKIKKEYSELLPKAKKEYSPF